MAKTASQIGTWARGRNADFDWDSFDSEAYTATPARRTVNEPSTPGVTA